MRRHKKAAPVEILGRVGCRIALLALGVLVLLTASVPAASAAPEAGPGWSYKSSFGEFFGFQYETPSHPVAVDENGNVFVVTDQGLITYTIRIFSPTAEGGAPLAEFESIEPVRNIAVDPSGEVAYVDGVSPFSESIFRFVSDGAATPTFSRDTGFQISKGADLAVDPATDDLLVADPTAEAVLRYDDDGNLLATIATPSISPSFIVSAPDGSFYVAPSDGSSITHFSGAGTLLATIAEVGPLHGLTYDADRSLIVAAVGENLKSYSPSGALRSQSPAHDASGTGIAASGTGRLYELDGSNLNLYVPATVPGVEAPQVSNIAPHSVQVSAEVDPGEEPGGEPPAGSFARFEYSSDGGQSWSATPDQPLEGAGVVTLEADLTGLESNFDYLVRVTAGNSAVSGVSGTTPFHTPLATPEVETGNATSVGETSAELTGTIKTFGSHTTYHFEYGLTTDYGSRVPLEADASAGDLRRPRSVSRFVDGLEPNTTYHYRLVATNAAGTTEGPDRTFASRAVGETPTRAYEQVTPVDKGGAAVAFASHFQTSDDGSKFVVPTNSGSAAESETAYIYNHFLSIRGEEDWADWKAIDPPTGTTTPAPFESATLAVSDDFTKAFVASNFVLAPGGVDGVGNGGGNLYIRDLRTDEYTFVAGSSDSLGFNRFTTAQSFLKVFIGGADDFSWVVFESDLPLLPGAPSWATYRWSEDGGLEIVSRLPDGSIPSVPGISMDPRATNPLVSDDGSVIGFSVEGLGAYLWENGVVKAISIPPDEPDTVKPGYVYGLSRDGRFAFVGIAGQFYRYDTQSESLEYIDEQPTNLSEFRGTSDSGNTVYYEIPGHTWSWRDGVVDQVTDSSEHLQTAVSPNGRFYVYVSGDSGAYLYDADEQSSVCISCTPDGSSTGNARIKEINKNISNRPVQAVTDEGEAFFDTPARLAGADQNSKRDVYSYKDGRTTLISPGNADVNARFMAASRDGSSVFFATSQGLVAQDTDGETDVYVARVGGGLPKQQEVPATPCRGDDCQAPATPSPAVLDPGSSSLTGAGNRVKKHIRHCKKKKGKKKKTCKARKHASRTAGTNRGGSK